MPCVGVVLIAVVYLGVEVLVGGVRTGGHVYARARLFLGNGKDTTFADDER
jgi:hypothetical protein